MRSSSSSEREKNNAQQQQQQHASTYIPKRRRDRRSEAEKKAASKRVYTQATKWNNTSLKAIHKCRRKERKKNHFKVCFAVVLLSNRSFVRFFFIHLLARCCFDVFAFPPLFYSAFDGWHMQNLCVFFPFLSLSPSVNARVCDVCTATCLIPCYVRTLYRSRLTIKFYIGIGMQKMYVTIVSSPYTQAESAFFK